MAKKRKTKESSTGENYFIISLEKKKKILGIFLTVFALLILLSILSYSRTDLALGYSFTDLFKVFSDNPEFQTKLKNTNNFLNIFGVIISNFLINSTLGYFSIAFPVIMFVWGLSIIKQDQFKLAVYISNFTLAIAVILATFFGVLRFSPEINLFFEINELSGNIGGFFGKGLSRLIGGLGSIIFLITLLFVVLFITFDIKLEKIINGIKDIFSGAFNDDESEEADTKIRINNKDEENLSNLDKIKKLKKNKPKEETTDEEVIAKTPEEIEEETRIRILQKEQTEELVETTFLDDAIDQADKNTDPKENKEKKKVKTDLPDEPINFEEEEELPNQWEEKIEYKAPSMDLLTQSELENVKIPETELKRNAELLKDKLALFDIKIEDIDVTPGPVVTLYEIVPAPGVKISRIVSLEHDIALALAARGIRIIAPIPGKSAIGVEIPNAEAQLVNARSVLAKIKESKAELPLALGKTISGDIYITDLAKMPHLLIAGSTGAGKSVGINMMITSLIYAKHPSDVKFVIVDPKKIELSFYKKLSKHFLAVSPDLEEEIITNPQNALLVLKAVEYEMEKRYNKLAKAGVRNIVDYNEKVADPKRKPKDTDEMKHHKLPYIVVIIDELADLMMTSGKEVEEPIARLAQLARAVGIHLIVATQRPSVNVITGTIKANFSARVAYQTATRIDSRTILDMNGAETLLGRGDMLFLPGGMPKPVRIQNAFITTDEVEKITDHIYIQKGYAKRYFLPSMFEKKMQSEGSFLADLDPMFDEAARVIVRHQQGSVSLLQRRLKLGYSRAARIVDQLEQAGVVGPSEGSKAREVLIESEQQLDSLLRNLN
ncbi:MAG: DNA translocase FtsK 4TM domain-containing protein [Melioribacteraceae bacterium]|nr:DNA translocase FtsK 4TM domain-containing protein [Melioribacteraceae bacterium]